MLHAEEVLKLFPPITDDKGNDYWDREDIIKMIEAAQQDILKEIALFLDEHNDSFGWSKGKCLLEDKLANLITE